MCPQQAFPARYTGETGSSADRGGVGCREPTELNPSCRQICSAAFSVAGDASRRSCHRSSPESSFVGKALQLLPSPLLPPLQPGADGPLSKSSFCAAPGLPRQALSQPAPFLAAAGAGLLSSQERAACSFGFPALGCPRQGWHPRAGLGMPYPGRIAFPEPFHPCRQSLCRGCDSPSAARLLPELAGRSRAEIPGWQPCLADLACEPIPSRSAARKEPQALILLLGCSPLSSVVAKLRDSHPLGVQSRRLWHQPSSRQAQESCHQLPRATCSAGRQVFPSTVAVWRVSSMVL